MQDLTTVPIRKPTRDRLRLFGVKGESYDQILQRLMEIAEENGFWDRQLGILTGSRFHSLDEV